MARPWRRLVGIGGLVLVAAMVLAASNSAAAPSRELAAQTGATVVKTGVYLLNVGRLDTLSGSFTADFYLRFRCDVACDPSQFEFMNGRATFLDKQYSDAQEQLYRVQAALTTNVDFSSYPFDRHRLLIALEDKHLSHEDLVFQVDPESSGVDSHVIVSGWELAGWDAGVTMHYYPTYGDTYSRYEFYVEIRRGVWAAVLKGLLPALVIVLGGFLGFLLGPERSLQRLTVNTGALTGAILFHVNLTSQIPPAGSLTYVDKFMITNYLGLVGALAASVALLILSDRKREALALKVHRVSGLVIPVVWALMQIGVATTL
ncbi:MAG: hypothetical protein FJ315_04490 [SAR202 cluster bacterium]|nr:hypothetical protein [SAR202 cluster bacterium]